MAGDPLKPIVFSWPSRGIMASYNFTLYDFTQKKRIFNVSD